jgi:hypothetical protein
MFRTALVFVVLAACCGCAARRVTSTYRLVRQSDRLVLIPPGISRVSLVRRSLILPVPPGRGACTSIGGIEIRKRGKRLRATVAPDVLARQTPGWLTGWASDAEAAGCIAAGYGSSLPALIVDAVPLPLPVAWSLLHVNDVRAGYVDVGAGNRLQVDSPIYEDGVAQSSAADALAITGGSNTSINVEMKAPPGLIGFERAWYTVQPKQDRAGFAIVPLSAERHIKGEIEARPKPAANYFQFGTDAAYYRLLYRSDRTIVVIGAARYAELEALTRQAAGDASLCSGARQSCVLIPNNVGVNLDIAVHVNGRDLLLPAGANVAAAISAAGASPREVLAHLRVSRSHAGSLTAVEFDPAAEDILSLRLNGGETLTW